MHLPLAAASHTPLCEQSPFETHGHRMRAESVPPSGVGIHSASTRQVQSFVCETLRGLRAKQMLEQRCSGDDALRHAMVAAAHAAKLGAVPNARNAGAFWFEQAFEAGWVSTGGVPNSNISDGAERTAYRGFSAKNTN